MLTLYCYTTDEELTQARTVLSYFENSTSNYLVLRYNLIGDLYEIIISTDNALRGQVLSSSELQAYLYNQNLITHLCCSAHIDSDEVTNLSHLAQKILYS